MTLTRKSGLNAMSEKTKAKRKKAGQSLYSTFTAKPQKLEPNPERQAKRRKANAKYYASPEWQAIRLETFERDGWQCTRIITIRGAVAREYTGKDAATFRCPFVDESRTGRGLVCDEESYAHRGRPGKTPKTRTLCTRCSEIETVRLRANHFNGFNR